MPQRYFRIKRNYFNEYEKRNARQIHPFSPEQSTEGVPLGATSIDDITKLSLISALKACGGNRRRAAQRLNVSLHTVDDMIRRYDLVEL